MNNWFAPIVEGEVSKDDILARSEEFHKWKFEPLSMQENGYEDIEHDLNQFGAEEYEALDEEGKKAYVQEVIDLFREIDLLPIQYYSYNGVLNEIQRCIAYGASFNGDTVSCGAGVGTTLCNYLFPNIFDTPSLHDIDKEGAETLYAKFHNDKYLGQAIKFCFSYKNGKPTPTNVMGGLRLVGSAPTNFRPMNAKAIYERFAPEGGVIYDYCTGFGGRMLGCLSSSKNFKYVGTDPNTETMYNMHRLGAFIEEATGRKDSFELHCCGSEVFVGPKDSVDFAFSSPPYFNLEVYSTEETQCFNKFPVLEDWLEGYVRQTIKNIHHMLKPGRCYAVNIADFNVSGNVVKYVDEWIRLSSEEGMPLLDVVYLGVTARAGSKQQAKGELKKEPILVFKKV